MANKNFTQFDLRVPPLTSDFLVGYKADGTAEYRTTVQQIINLVGETDSQTLSFNENNKDLSISLGNTVSLSSLATNNFVQTNFLPLTGGTITGATRIDNNFTVQGEISASNVIYDATGNSDQWNIAFNAATFVQNNSASWEESADILPTVTNYLSTNNVPISALTITNSFSGINSLTISGNISGNNLRTSFNQGSATGNFSFAEGSGKASGNYSHAEGFNTLASNDYSHAEGFNTVASGVYSHAEGTSTTASNLNSHAEGGGTIASGNGSHAEGFNTKAAGIYSHAGGGFTVADGLNSHAIGRRSTAAQDYTYAWSDGNLGTVTANVSTTRTGQYMVSASGGVFIPGNVGIRTDNNSNALTVNGVISSNNIVHSNNGSSNQWNSVYTNVQSNSASWEESADITAITTTVATNSGNWNTAFNRSTQYQNISSTFATNTTVNIISSLLTPLTLTNNLTSQLVLNTDFNNYRTSVASATASNIAYVNTNFLPLTGGTITGQISSNKTIIANNITVTDNLSTLVHVTDFTTSKTFLNSDTSRVFHFDTTTQPLCAIFPNTLPDGFNVAVMNTGTNTLRLSASQLNSVGVTIGVRYGGAFVYKDNNQLFAVGRL